MLYKLVLIIFLLVGTCSAQEIIPDFKEESVPILNEELRRINNVAFDISSAETDIDELQDKFPVDLTSTDITGVLTLDHGGTEANLTDPGADRIMFWDDGGTTMNWLTPGDNISITGTSLDVSLAAITSDIELISVTTMSAATLSDNISITSGVNYKVVVILDAGSTPSSYVGLRFNSGSGNTYANAGETLPNSTYIDIAASMNGDTGMLAEFTMGTYDTNRQIVCGQSTFLAATTAVLTRQEIVGAWNNSTAATDFEIITSHAVSGKIILYKLNES